MARRDRKTWTPLEMCHNALNMIRDITQELSFETICEKRQENQTYLKNPSLKLLDGLYRKYIWYKKMVDKYDREHDPLPQLSHYRLDFGDCQREEVKQDNDLYYLNITIHTIMNNKDHKRFKGKRYKHINDIYCLNLKIKSQNKFIDI